MSEQEKQHAIAKMKARAISKWMTLVIVAPVFVCAILTLVGPMIQDNLARNEANTECAERINIVDPVANSTQVDTERIDGEAIITADNLSEMVLFSGEARLDIPVARRDTTEAIAHPIGDYTIIAGYRPSYATPFYICTDNGTALGAFTGDETAGDVVFNSDGSLFAVSDGRMGRILLFDGVAIERLRTLDVAHADGTPFIDSIAFHPTQPLLFVTADNELSIYDLNSYDELFRIPIFVTSLHEIGFDDDGSLFFMSSIGETSSESYVWGVRN